MTSPKIELFTIELQEKAEIFKALSHPARLKIIQFLSESESCITGDITEIIPLGRTTINQHLKELKKIGLIKGEVCGTKKKYCLNPEKVKQVSEYFNNFLKEISNNNNC